MTNIVRIVDADWSGSMRNDLISRQGAIDALGEKPVGETDWDLGCRNQWEWDTEILRTLPSAEPERKWISVVEALPEEKGEYLVSYHPCHWNAVSEKVAVGIDTFRGKTTWAKKKYQKVIAWMSMPEPYEGD